MQLRKIKISRKRSVTNLSKAMKESRFRELMGRFYEKYDNDRVDAMANQLFSADGSDIESLQQFAVELDYDLGTKNVVGEELTLQEQYMTEYGWRRPERSNIIGPVQQLKLYRTMSTADWKALSGGDSNVLVGGHIGDFKQALRYFMGQSNDSKVMVEFTLKAGSERILFSSSLAFPRDRTRKLQIMADAIGADSYPVCSASEGTSPNAIGIKSESEGEAGFSIGIGGGGTPDAFMALVDTMELKQIDGEYSNEGSAGSNSRVEADACLLLDVNNCLINAIALAVRNCVATREELIGIRSVMNNYGEMLIASPEVIGHIRRVLQIDVPISIVYQDGAPSEDFDGDGDRVFVYHVNGNHFTHEAPE